ncbi:hypothetical protein THAR02_02426 [Trichoderma harzianum]|uniref:Uncharacterized protein n=1 Tax=Trichoderma harzianum TaxID=5544 RepID=A0A0F9XKV0_TRIHA|nr:hypothetical protein THAR02_02426 [Trichoderma harzianum]
MVAACTATLPRHTASPENVAPRIFLTGTRDSAALGQKPVQWPSGVIEVMLSQELTMGVQKEETVFCSTLKSLGRLEDELQMLSIAAVVATKPSPQDTCTDRDTVGSEPNNTTTVAGWFHRN